MRPKVSIVVTVFKAEKYIERCVRSLFEQTLDDVEFLFINDCTPDRSIEIILNVIKDYPHRGSQTRIVSLKENGGSSHAKRIGMQEAKGEFIASIDSDDWLELDAYQKMLHVAERENADIVCCEIVRETPEGGVLECYKYDVETIDDVIEHLEYGIYSSLANKLIRRSLIEKNNILPLDGISMWDDLSATARLRYFSRKTMIIHEALYHYNCLNTESVTSKPNSVKRTSMIVCADFLSNYFVDIMPHRHYFKLMRLCFRAKEPLFYPQEYDFIRWKSSVSKSNKFIMKFSDIPLWKRLQYIFFLYLPNNIGDFILKKHYNI